MPRSRLPQVAEHRGNYCTVTAKHPLINGLDSSEKGILLHDGPQQAESREVRKAPLHRQAAFGRLGRFPVNLLSELREDSEAMSGKP